jgi:hypothetical protein
MTVFVAKEVPRKGEVEFRAHAAMAEQISAENIVEYWHGMNIGVPKADKPDF